MENVTVLRKKEKFFLHTGITLFQLLTDISRSLQGDNWQEGRSVCFGLSLKVAEESYLEFRLDYCSWHLVLLLPHSKWYRFRMSKSSRMGDRRTVLTKSSKRVK